jgi:mycothiol synthase
MHPDLRVGFTSRPGTPADIPALSALDSDYCTRLFGRALRTEGEIRTEWSAPAFHPATDSRVVTDAEGRIAAWVEIYDSPPHVTIPSRLRVAPSGVPDGVVDHLIGWAADRARRAIELAPPGARVAFTQGAFEADIRANERLLAAGLAPIRTFLRMQIELHDPPQAPVWPEGISVRTFVPGEDDEPALHVARDVFSDHWGHVETPFEDDLAEWRTWIYEDEDFDTDLWFLGTDGEAIVGFCQCYPVGGDDPRVGLIDELGVVRSHRQRGLATALLLHAFGALYERGRTIVELGVDADSLTGATRLYEKVGMRLTRRTNLYELELRTGRDITKRS